MPTPNAASSAFRTLLIGVLCVFALWYAAPLLLGRIQRAEAEPRTVVARGELDADEKNNISIFESSKASVVYISTRERVVDFWTRNVMTVPRGTGSGFIWDA